MALKHLVGSSGPVNVSYEKSTYISNGFDEKNPSQVFLKLNTPGPQNNITFSGHSDRSGAFAAPDMQIQALSRLMGPVAADPTSMNTGASGLFDPNQYFGQFLQSAVLFGSIPLAEVLAKVGLGDPSKLPRFISDTITKLDAFLNDVDAATTLVTALATDVAALKADTDTVLGDLSNLTNDLHAVMKDTSAVQGLQTDLKRFVTDLGKLLNDLPANGAVADAKRQLQQIFARFNQEDSLIDTILSEQITVKFVWNPKIQPWPTGKNATNPPIFQPNNLDGFQISVELQVSKTAQEPAMDIYCALRDFNLNLLPVGDGLFKGPFVIVNFDTFEFTVTTGKSPDVNLKLAANPIFFGGCLSFVNTLSQIIPFDAFSDPPALSVTTQGIDATYSLGLPTIGIGVFSLQNVSLGAGLHVPFIVNPLEVDFNFCTREQPFVVTVSLFGGGGYFLMRLKPRDLKAAPGGLYIEASIEFGASISVNLGVASGGVHVMAGIMFSMDPNNADNTILDGYLRMGGNVSVLDIVSMSIELDLDLTWEPSDNSVIGSATITVEVSVAFFHQSVQISCQKQFAGPPPKTGMALVHGEIPATAAPPTFEDLMAPSGTEFPWRDYCHAFA
jgi:hypothetical protein